MTGINCPEAEKHWKERGGAVAYLEAIGFVATEKDENGDNYISLSTDEEGNSDIRLTKKASLWLAEVLKKLAEEVD